MDSEQNIIDIIFFITQINSFVVLNFKHLGNICLSIKAITAVCFYAATKTF